MRFYKQRGDYDCGITSLQSVLTSFNIHLSWKTIFDISQEAYKQDIRKTGVGVQGMRKTLKYANQLYNRNLKLRVVNNLTPAKLKNIINSGQRVIINGYNTDLTVNHFMVAYDYTEKIYKIWDPATAKHHWFNKKKLIKRWTYNGQKSVVIIYE